MLRTTLRGHNGRRRCFASVRSHRALVEPIERRLLLATITVTSLADSGPGTLREAITMANDEVNFPGADDIDFTVTGTITLSSTLLINSPMSIKGAGAADLAISGGGAVRLFSTTGAPAGTNVEITDLTLRDGRTTTGAAVLVGNQNLTVRNCVVAANVGTSTGGAVTVNAGSGTLTVDVCTFSGNSSTAGGGITCSSGTGMLITNSTFTQNVTTIGNAGGAIRFAGTVGPFGVTIRNCTISDNQSGFNGGGIGFGNNFVGTANIQNSTITNNRSVNLGGGGGIGVNTTGSTGTVVLESCIVSGNFVTGSGNGPDLFAGPNVPIIANFCAIGSTAGAANFTPDATTTALVGQNFNLAALGNNGGPTQTHAINTPSPVIDNGSNVAGLAFDQRGPGFPRVAGAQADIGAYEVSAPAAPTVQNSQFNFETSHSVVVTFSEAVTFPNGINAAFAVQNLTTNTPVAFTAVQNGIGVTLTFTPIILDDGHYEATVIAANVAGAGGPMAANHVLPFFFLNGDADRNGTVNLADFNTLASNFGQSGRNFSQGNFDYDAGGNVNLSDFNILASRFGTSVAPHESLFARSRLAQDATAEDVLTEMLD